MACIDCNNTLTLPTGSAGPAGTTGVAGSVGPTGATGAVGAAGVDAPPISVDSITSQTISVAQKTFTTDVAFGFNDYARVRAANSASNYMEGTVNPSSTGTSLIVDVDRVVGSGTYSVWAISTAGDLGATGTTGSTGAAGAGYTATSSSNIALAVASTAWTTQAGLAYTAGARVRVANSSTNYAEGPVTSYSGTTLTVNVDRIVGSGTYNNWTINIAGDVTTLTDTGWVSLDGFSHMPSNVRPQYRVLNKQIAFRGNAVIPLSTDTGGTTTGLTLEAYTTEDDYASSTGQVVPFQGTGGVDVNTGGTVVFNRSATVITGYSPDTTYSKQTIGFRRVDSSTSTEEIVYTGFFNVYISATGILTVQTIKDAEIFNGATSFVGHSPLRNAMASVTSGDYVTQLGSESVGAVAQATNITTAVTLNRRKGVITTQAASAAASASHTFTVNNTLTTVNSVILVSITDYSGTIGTNGIPEVIVDNKVAGTSFDIIISNTDAADALNGTLTIAYEIIPANATLTHQVTLDAAEPLQIGGFNINLDGLVAYLA